MRDFSLRDFGASLNTVESYTNESSFSNSFGKIELCETANKQKCTHLGMFLASEFNGCSIIEKDCISTKRFEYDKFLLGSRSPHIVSGNILIAKNIHNDLIDKYFNLSNEIVYINAINTNILQRLNGCDYDSDTLLLTDNKILVEKAMENYNKFKVPTCFVQAEKTKRFYTNEDKADLDTKTSVNKIGEIINFSQYLNSIMWDKILKNGESIEDNLDIYYDACKLAVLSGIEIDRSKKEFLVNTKNEIDTLKSKYQIIESDRIVKPVFFKNITMDNGYKLNKNHKYVYFDTPMDYIQKSIKRLKKELKNDSIANVNFSEIVKKPSENPTRTDYRKKNSVIDKIIETKNEILKLFTQNVTDSSSIYDKYNSLKEECVNYINFTANTENSVYLLLKVLEDKQYRNIHSLLSFSLFGCPNEIFFNMILENRGKNEILIEDSNGDISFYGFNFIKKSI